MELLNRQYQRSLLERLSETYPGVVGTAKFFAGEDVRVRDYNLAYLEEHGLVTGKWAQTLNGPRQSLQASITAKGIDFLTDDGGLSAVLGVITVKLHDDTIRQLLITKVEGAEGDPKIKESLIKKIKEMPAEALGTLMTTGLGAALDQVPNAISLLRSILHL